MSAAFQARDDRTFTAMKDRARGMQPLYVLERQKYEGVDILDSAGLGLDLPSERDTVRLVRYEGTITRSLRNALAQLEKRQARRRNRRKRARQRVRRRGRRRGIGAGLGKLSNEAK